MAGCTVEEMVAALPKVDSEGITGQRSKKAALRKAAKADEPRDQA
jgi:hypothetical protein